MHSDATEIEAPLLATGPGEITAGDIAVPTGVEVLNPNVHLATLERNTKLELYVTVGRGRGYRPAEENTSADRPLGVIAIDSTFSPVRRVAYAVAPVGVGERDDYDTLTLDIDTDGSIDPRVALREAAEILIAQLVLFTDPDGIHQRRPGDELETSSSDGTLSGVLAAADPEHEILIEELELSVRSYNCLKRSGIQTVGDLIARSENELNAIPNFGKRSIDEVIQTLHDRGLKLRGS